MGVGFFDEKWYADLQAAQEAEYAPQHTPEDYMAMVSPERTPVTQLPTASEASGGALQVSRTRNPFTLKALGLDLDPAQQNKSPLSDALRSMAEAKAAQTTSEGSSDG